MLYSDTDLIENRGLTYDVRPFNSASVQPASLDLTLSDEFLVFRPHKMGVIDPLIEDASRYMKRVKVEDGNTFVLHPGEFVLGSTTETVKLSSHVAGAVMGKSSLARLGLIIHTTAGFIDPLFEGSITLEMANMAPAPLRLSPGMWIGQLALYELKTKCEIGYGDLERNSKYQGQTGPVASKYFMNEE